MKYIFNILILALAMSANAQSVKEVYVVSSTDTTELVFQIHAFDASGNLIGVQQPMYLSQVDSLKKMLQTFVNNYVPSAPLVEASVTINETDCIDANVGYELSLSGSFTFYDGCTVRSEINGDLFDFSGDYAITDLVGCTLSGSTVTMKSVNWSFKVSGLFTATKNGGSYADFKIKSKQL